MTANEQLRGLPSVAELAAALDDVSHELAVRAAREVIAEARGSVLAGAETAVAAKALRDQARERAVELARGSLRRVINATGVVLHTNLGRAPLAPLAAEAAGEIASAYSNLEYDVTRGERSSRGAHVEDLLTDLSGAEAAIAVNNNAAAVLLALAATAGDGEVIVSRGHLVEIGGSFRIPEILELSRARLIEVGTTNRTRRADYERAVGPKTAALLRVHQSNFRVVGFTEEASLDDLCQLASERELAVIDDIGSGAVAPFRDEPVLASSVSAGVDLVCASADKLLGGPQAGLICGRAQAVARCRHHPLARALRLDKLQLAALAATLRLHRDGQANEIPALAMLSASEEELAARAELMARVVGEHAEIIDGAARPGGGTLPLLELPGPVCVIDPGEAGADELARRLRCGEPPVIARILEGKVVLDPRTMLGAEPELAAQAARRARG